MTRVMMMFLDNGVRRVGMVHGMLVELLHLLDVMLVIVLVIKLVSGSCRLSVTIMIISIAMTCIVMQQFMRLFVLVTVYVLHEMASMILSWLLDQVPPCIMVWARAPAAVMLN